MPTAAAPPDPNWPEDGEPLKQPVAMSMPQMPNPNTNTPPTTINKMAHHSNVSSAGAAVVVVGAAVVVSALGKINPKAASA